MRQGSAEPDYRIPDAPTVGGSVRAALIDFFYNSWRLVPANFLWGVGLLALIIVFFAWPLAALPLLVLLALPAAGVFRLATLIVRQRPVAFSDALSAWREFLRPALITGAALSFITLVLGTNIVIGFGSAEPIGWGIATAALWGLVATWAVALPYWPLLLDPVRAGTPMRDTLRLAGALVLVSPLRFLALFAVVTIVFVASAVFFAALLTISVAFIALLLAHYTLPAADRLEQRQTHAILR